MYMIYLCNERKALMHVCFNFGNSCFKKCLVLTQLQVFLLQYALIFPCINGYGYSASLLAVIMTIHVQMA